MIFTLGIEKVVFLNSYAEYKGIEIDEGLAFLEKFKGEIRELPELV